MTSPCLACRLEQNWSETEVQKSSSVCSRESQALGEAGGMQGEEHGRFLFFFLIICSVFIIHDGGVRVGGAETRGQTL